MEAAGQVPAACQIHYKPSQIELRSITTYLELADSLDGEFLSHNAF